MKKTLNTLIIILLTFSSTLSFSQSKAKDFLFFTDKNNYLELKVNYENNHRFFFRNEEFVSSAFEAGISITTMNHFAQSYKSIILKNFKPKTIYDIKEYLNNNRKKLIDSISKKYDSYKLMLHFDKFNVFIKKGNGFIKVKYSTPLAE